MSTTNDRENAQWLDALARSHAPRDPRMQAQPPRSRAARRIEEKETARRFFSSPRPTLDAESLMAKHDERLRAMQIDLLMQQRTSLVLQFNAAIEALDYETASRIRYGEIPAISKLLATLTEG